MIYIYEKANNTITTDNLTNYIPGSVSVYLDEVLIGTYLNTTSNLSFIVFTIPSSDLQTLENKEYIMKLRNASNATVIKSELVVIKSIITPEFNEVINKKTEIFYGE